MRLADRIGTALWVLAAMCVRLPQACFPLEDILTFDTPWKQRTSLNSYTIMTADIRQREYLYLKYFVDDVLIESKELECVVAHGNYKYLVKEDNPIVESTFYSCLHIELKVEGIIRMKQTTINTSRKKVHCMYGDYLEDDFIWYSLTRHDEVSCPLTGGYQLIISADNMALSSYCVNSLHTFNPRIQFECDNVTSGQVVIETGDDCMLTQLWEKAILNKRNFVFLRCIGHWAEGAITSLVLQVVENEAFVWCLQYQVILPKDGFYPMYLSVLGYCPSKAFESNSAVYDSLFTVYGALASYVPYGNPKCIEHRGKTEGCQENIRVCVSSNQCPVACNRCVKFRPHPVCSFHEMFHGDWKPFSTKIKISVSVSNDSILGAFGQMQCRSPPTLYKNGNHGYGLEQVGSVRSCMPIYACVKLNPLAPGIMFFQFQTIGRRQSTGEPYSCVEANDRWGHLTVLYFERPMVLFDRSRLRRVSCNFTDNALYRTSLEDCRIAVKNCTGNCTTLRVELDSNTCSNETIALHPILSEHNCLKTMRFGAKFMVLLTENADSKNSKYFCWIFSTALVFIISPEDCYEKGAKRVVNNVKSVALYDPVVVLAISQRSEISKASDRHPSVAIALLLLTLTEVFKNMRFHQH